MPPATLLPEEVQTKYRAERDVWNKIRLHRILVDYYLRQGYYDSALVLADVANIKVIFFNPLVNIFFIGNGRCRYFHKIESSCRRIDTT